ncbi:unnamed protein product, partial [Brassica napus]
VGVDNTRIVITCLSRGLTTTVELLRNFIHLQEHIYFTPFTYFILYSLQKNLKQATISDTTTTMKPFYQQFTWSMKYGFITPQTVFIYALQTSSHALQQSCSSYNDKQHRLDMKLRFKI